MFYFHTNHASVKLRNFNILYHKNPGKLASRRCIAHAVSERKTIPTVAVIPTGGRNLHINVV
jgi:hypothetical protein